MAAPAWTNPLDRPLAVAAGGVGLVLLVRGVGLALPLAILLAVAFSVAFAALPPRGGDGWAP